MAANHNMKRKQHILGVSLVEMLMVIAIAGIIMGFAIPRIRQMQQQQTELNTVRLISAQIRSAASYAGSRRMNLHMDHVTSLKKIQVVDDMGAIPDEQFTIEIPSNLNIPDGRLLNFNQFGQVQPGVWPISQTSDPAATAANTVTINGSGRTIVLRVSSIGDVKME